ncbi:MAG: hypothetical protein KGI54_08315 [Pseudomonadota bacterium]|nr:hypothetical protein [Pseudomonadota bacterium]
MCVVIPAIAAIAEAAADGMAAIGASEMAASATAFAGGMEGVGAGVLADSAAYGAGEATAGALSSNALMIGATALSTGAQLYGQSQQADAAQRSATDAYNYNMQQKNLEQTQINAQYSQQENQRMKDAMAAESRMMVSAGESGVAGVSVDRNYNEIAGAANQDISTLEANRAMKVNQTQAGARGLAAQTQGVINTNRGPSAIAAGLQIGGAVANTYAPTSRN